MTTIAERVAKGAPFMDEHDPEWWRPDVERAIDLETLDLAEGDKCVLGQRCPLAVLEDYSRAYRSAGLYAEDRYYAYAMKLAGLSGQNRREWSDDHGFSLPLWGDEDWGELTAEWRRVITGRRPAA